MAKGQGRKGAARSKRAAGAAGKSARRGRKTTRRAAASGQAVLKERAGKARETALAAAGDAPAEFVEAGRRVAGKAADYAREAGEQRSRAFGSAAEQGQRGLETVTRASADFFEEGRRAMERGMEAWRAATLGQAGNGQGRADMLQNAMGAGAEVSAKFADGVQQAASVVAEMAQDTMRQNVEIAQLMMRCRTVDDLMQVQSEWMRRTMEGFVARSSKLSQITTHVALSTMQGMGGGK